MSDVEALEHEIARLTSRVSELEAGLAIDPAVVSIAENSPSNIMLLDREGRIQYINRILPHLDETQVLGTPVYRFVGEEFHERVRHAFQRILETRQPDRYETEHVADDGSRSWWESSVGPVIRDGEVLGFAVISTNVTEQRRLAEEQERFFNLSVDMLCVANAHGYFTRINPAFEATLGLGEELLQRPYLDFVHPEDRDATRAAMKRLAGGEVLSDFENRYRCKTGEYLMLSWRATRDPVTQLIYAVARNVTYRRNLEEQLRQSQKMEAVGKLAGGVAHDFNNLLLAIQGNLEFAIQGVGVESNQHLNEAMLATQRAAALVRQLLALSRQQPINTVRLKLDVLLRSLMNLLRRLIPENIQIELETRDGKRAIVADRSQLEQVIINLCVNARDSMPDGGRVTLRVEDVSVDERLAGGHPWARPGDYVLLSVTDTGTGMSRQVQDRVFEPFYTTKPPGRGTGLGLATVYGIVQSHGGFITVESQLGRGSTFRIYLPAAEQADAPPESDARGAAGGSETILIAEDEEMVRSVVVRILASAGYRVITASDGIEAVNLFAEHPDVALVLLDVVMPRLGGPDAAARMRRIRADVRVLFTSGYVHASAEEGKLENEAVLAKPYRPEALLQQVRQLLDAD